MCDHWRGPRVARHTLCDVRKVAGRPVGEWVRYAILRGACLGVIAFNVIKAFDSDRGTPSRLGHALLATAVAGMGIYGIVILTRRSKDARDGL
jgi:hypothetical protein